MSQSDVDQSSFENAVVHAENLQFAFGERELKKQILFDIDFRVNRSEVVLLTGPSGSGKTTLLTLIGALRRLHEGSLCVLGRSLREATDQVLVEVRRRIGFIFQQHNLLEFLTAQQNVELVCQLQPSISRSEAKSVAARILTQVGLGTRLHYLPAKLSGGQKQRVAIARALAGNPELILADEPTAALDGQTGREVVTLLQSLAKDNGRAILMVTHDNRVLDIADRIVQIEDGRIVSAK